MPTHAQEAIFTAERVGSKLRADHPTRGVKIARRFTPLGGAQPGQGGATGAVHRSIVDRQLAGANGPLHGLRVVDLTRVWAGPLVARRASG